MSFGAVWCEHLALPELARALPLVGSRALHLAWPAADLARPERLALVRQAPVEIRPWLLLAQDQGYWAGASNAGAFADAALALMQLWAREGLRPSWLIVDMEPRYQRMMQLQERVKRRVPDLLGAVRLLADATPRAAHDAAARTFSDLCVEAHRRGWRVLLTTLPFAVDDAPGRDTVQRALELPVAGVPWDRVTLQAYRTAFLDLLPPWLGPARRRLFSPYVVTAYARAVRRRFGDRGGLDLGLVGAGVAPSVLYRDPADLALDLGAARAAGIPAGHLAIYNLEGMLARAPAERWLAAAAQPGRARPDLGTVPLRAALRLASRLGR